MNICVYCSSSNSIDPKYFAVAEQLGSLLAARGDTLVYGGASVGLMGTIARAVQAGGGRVVGVIPQILINLEVSYQHADELIVTEDMRGRKAAMESRADAFLALPGGIGTLEEVFEILVLRYLRAIDKPLVLLNVEGFYDPLIVLFEHMRAEGFVKPDYTSLYHLAPDVETAFRYLDGD
jgi:uncharacterized protein (TIGR00730 family)